VEQEYVDSGVSKEGKLRVGDIVNKRAVRASDTIIYISMRKVALLAYCLFLP